MRFFVGIIGILLAGCQPISQDKPSDRPFLIENQTVILDKSHILNTKTKLYQPSFELQGIVLPHNQQNIVAPTLAMVEKLAVKEGQEVKEGDVLLVLKPVELTNQPAADEELPSDNATQDDTQTQNDNAVNPKPTYTPTAEPAMIITAPFSGIIHRLSVQEQMVVGTGQVLAGLYDNHLYEFVSILPKHYEPHLKVGQSINFGAKTPTQTISKPDKTSLDNPPPSHPSQNFSGQISQIHHITADALSVTAQIIPQKDSPALTGIQVGGRVTYGDLTAGVIVPDFAIADGSSFKHLENPPHKPPTPLPAKIWVIRQDGKVHLTDIFIIEYLPSNDRYLVSGINQDSLISSANLPPSADGFLVKIR